MISQTQPKGSTTQGKAAPPATKPPAASPPKAAAEKSAPESAPAKEQAALPKPELKPDLSAAIAPAAPSLPQISKAAAPPPPPVLSASESPAPVSPPSKPLFQPNTTPAPPPTAPLLPPKPATPSTPASGGNAGGNVLQAVEQRLLLRKEEQEYNLHLQQELKPNVRVVAGEYVKVQLKIAANGEILSHEILERNAPDAFVMATELAIRNAKLNPLPAKLAENPPYIVVVRLEG